MPRLSPVREGAPAQEGPDGEEPEASGVGPFHSGGSSGAGSSSGDGAAGQAPDGAGAGAGSSSAAAEGPEGEA
eukprot:12124923-Alexandrium_andersonii.AAC.1